MVAPPPAIPALLLLPQPVQQNGTWEVITIENPYCFLPIDDETLLTTSKR